MDSAFSVAMIRYIYVYMNTSKSNLMIDLDGNVLLV